MLRTQDSLLCSYLNRSSCNLASLEETLPGTKAIGPSCCGGTWPGPLGSHCSAHLGSGAPAAPWWPFPAMWLCLTAPGLPPGLRLPPALLRSPLGGWSAVNTPGLRPGGPGVRVWSRGPSQGICLSFQSLISVQSDPGCWFFPCAYKTAHELWVRLQPSAPVMEGDQRP